MALLIEVYVNKVDGNLYKRRGNCAIRDDGSVMKIEDDKEFWKVMVRINDPISAYHFIGEELRGRGISLDKPSSN